MDASPYAVSMSNDSALASHWFSFFCDGKPDDYGRTSNHPMVKTKLRGRRGTVLICLQGSAFNSVLTQLWCR
jgi:hypothetical protein